jgi:hypothetical protein
MKKSLIHLAVLAAAGTIRARTHDVAFAYRMGAGFPGDVNRTHPASIVPGLMDTDDPVAAYGYPVLVDNAAAAYRGVLTADQATVTSIAGVLVRPYPTQQTTQTSMDSPIGAATPPTSGVVDVIEDGFVLVKNNNNAVNAATKGGAVYVWAAASAGNHVEGGFEAAATGGSTIALTNAEFNGPADANGVCEIRVWKAKRT